MKKINSTNIGTTISAEEAHTAIDALRAAAAAAGLQDMSLQEINQIIAETRKKKKSRLQLLI